MQYHIINLCLKMIEQDWNSSKFGIKLEVYAHTYRGVATYQDKLASAWYLLNQLRPHY